MGTYIDVVNKTRKLHFSGHTFDEGAKVFESIVTGRAARALVALMLNEWSEDEVRIERDAPYLDVDESWREMTREELEGAIERADLHLSDPLAEAVELLRALVPAAAKAHDADDLWPAEVEALQKARHLLARYPVKP